MKTKDGKSFWNERLTTATGRLNQHSLRREVIKRGGTVEDDSAGRWRVLQLVAPEGKLWSEGLLQIRVEWPRGESSEMACRDALERITRQTFIPIPDDQKEFYANE